MFGDYQSQFENLETQMSGKKKNYLVTAFDVLLAQYHHNLKDLSEMKKFLNEEAPDHGPDPKSFEALSKAIDDLALVSLVYRNKIVIEERRRLEGEIQQPIQIQMKQELRQKEVVISKKEKKFRAKDRKKKESLQTENSVQFQNQFMAIEASDSVSEEQQVPEDQIDDPTILAQIRGLPQDLQFQIPQTVLPIQQVPAMVDGQQIQLPVNDQQGSQGSDHVSNEEPMLVEKRNLLKSPRKQQMTHQQFNQQQLPQIQNPTNEDVRGLTD